MAKKRKSTTQGPQRIAPTTAKARIALVQELDLLISRKMVPEFLANMDQFTLTQKLIVVDMLGCAFENWSRHDVPPPLAFRPEIGMMLCIGAGFIGRQMIAAEHLRLGGSLEDFL